MFLLYIVDSSEFSIQTNSPSAFRYSKCLLTRNANWFWFNKIFIKFIYRINHWFIVNVFTTLCGICKTRWLRLLRNIYYSIIFDSTNCFDVNQIQIHHFNMGKTLKKTNSNFCLYIYVNLCFSCHAWCQIYIGKHLRKNCQAIPFWQAKVILNTKIA